MENRKSLKERVKEIGVLSPLMEGKEKGEIDELINKEITIINYDFVKDKEGKEYVAFLIKETNKFYFGGLVLTENLRELDLEGYGEDIRAEGIKCILNKRKSKNGMTYTNVDYIG